MNKGTISTINKEINSLLVSLPSIGNVLLKHYLLKNQALVVNEANALDKLIEGFEQEKSKLIVSHSTKGEDGNPVIENNSYKFTKDDFAKLQMDVEELVAKYKEDLDSYGEIAKEEVDIKLHEVDIELLTDVELTTQQLINLQPIIRG